MISEKCGRLDYYSPNPKGLLCRLTILNMCELHRKVVPIGHKYFDSIFLVTFHSNCWLLIIFLKQNYVKDLKSDRYSGQKPFFPQSVLPCACAHSFLFWAGIIFMHFQFRFYFLHVSIYLSDMLVVLTGILWFDWHVGGFGKLDG